MHVTAPGTPAEDLLCKMVSVLRHRGPDESGIFLDPVAGLGHARLSIIGLADGIQPLANEDETLWIVFNGEIFNYVELRTALIKTGHRFRTETDTEVILHLYEELGADCLAELNGQFAFAIWDSVDKELFLARDRVGIRPLFTTCHNGRFLFASEIKALFVDPEIPRRIDPLALQQIFTCWTTIGQRTTFAGIDQLPPGHFQVVRSGAAPGRPRPYWSLPYYPPEQQWPGTREEALEELRHLLQDAIRLRLRADVPVGAYLSGGLDSSILTSIIARKFNNRLKTFSLGFENRDFDEAEFQRALVDELGTDHQQITVSNQQIRDRFADVVWHCEKPLLRTGPVPLFLLSGLVREHQFKVVLTGEGADEVFGGYNIFKEAKIRSFWGRQPDSRLRPRLLQRLYPYIFQHAAQAKPFLQQFFALGNDALTDPLISHRKRWETAGKNLTFFSPELLAQFNSVNPVAALTDRLPAGFAERDIFARTQWLEMELFMANYLLSSQGDRVAMAHSLELRLPYLDYRLIDFAARLPSHWKMPGLQEKHLLKLAYRGQIPDAIRDRAKQPYRAPGVPVFFNQPGGDARELLCLEQLDRAGIFNRQKVQNLFEKQRRATTAPVSEMQSMAVVGILSTQLIHDQFIARDHGRSVIPVIPNKMVKRFPNGAWYDRRLHATYRHSLTMEEG